MKTSAPAVDAISRPPWRLHESPLCQRNQREATERSAPGSNRVLTDRIEHDHGNLALGLLRVIGIGGPEFQS